MPSNISKISNELITLDNQTKSLWVLAGITTLVGRHMPMAFASMSMFTLGLRSAKLDIYQSTRRSEMGRFTTPPDPYPGFFGRSETGQQLEKGLAEGYQWLSKAYQDSPLKHRVEELQESIFTRKGPE